MPETGTRKGSGRRPAGAQPAAADEADGARPLVCNVAFCPICMAVTAAQGAAPETVEHLLKAAREFFFAARAVIDARGDHLAGAENPRKPDLQKIDIA